MSTDAIKRAAELIHNAKTVVVLAGAGMGVDAGLPDFRGPEGFWRAYPPYQALGLGFHDLACPDTFRSDPTLAWGFYGHRLRLYRDTRPHDGYRLIKSLTAHKQVLVVTSNVDGAFRSPAIDLPAWEVHGSIHHLQCLEHARCPGWGPDMEGLVGRSDVRMWPWPAEPVEVDLATMRAVGALPTCPACGSLARPTILMFGDDGWDGRISDMQERAFTRALQRAPGPHVFLELGAGLAIPTIRSMAQSLTRKYRGTLIRVNPRDYAVPDPTRDVSLPMGALEALRAIVEE